MTAEEWALIASVVFTGLFSGLYGMLNLILHQVMRGMKGPEFARFLRRFLTVARKSPFNYVVVIGMVLAPAVALIATDHAGGTPFVLTTIGLALTLGGNAVVSNRIAEPNCDRMLAWDPDHMPADWEASGGTTSSSTGSGLSPPGPRSLSSLPRSWNRSKPHGAALTREREPPAGEAVSGRATDRASLGAYLLGVWRTTSWLWRLHASRVQAQAAEARTWRTGPFR